MINTGMNKDKPVIQSQLSDTSTQKSTQRGGVKQRQKEQERELKQLKAIQLLQQQGNNDLNNMNVEMPDIQGTVGQLTGLQPSSCAQSPCLSVWLKLKKTGSISTINKERSDPQINEDYEDNGKEKEDKQTNEAALIQNKNQRVNIISYPPVQENLGTQKQNNHGLNVLSQMDKYNPSTAQFGVQGKPKKGRGSKKTKTDCLIATNESSYGSNTQAQPKTAFAVQKPKGSLK
ncbi:MAG: hypothetical protein EZS28_024272 [Streblomastix strix]|uniref:Uncharacterized protein n=1 Tax=Streblomastix strix TaxID=222440 RepID=A0A5J4VC92_9EUKA|nr:MAG: hypothetical protein EZS28_024272 [Streblomastix strix]